MSPNLFLKWQIQNFFCRVQVGTLCLLRIRQTNRKSWRFLSVPLGTRCLQTLSIRSNKTMKIVSYRYSTCCITVYILLFAVTDAWPLIVCFKLKYNIVVFTTTCINCSLWFKRKLHWPKGLLTLTLIDFYYIELAYIPSGYDTVRVSGL